MTMVREDAMEVDAMMGIGGEFVKLSSDVCAEGSVLQGDSVEFRASLPGQHQLSADANLSTIQCTFTLVTYTTQRTPSQKRANEQKRYPN